MVDAMGEKGFIGGGNVAIARFNECHSDTGVGWILTNGTIAGRLSRLLSCESERSCESIGESVVSERQYYIPFGCDVHESGTGSGER